MAESQQDSVKIDLKEIEDKFMSSLLKDDDVDMVPFLDASKELNRFLSLMGPIFSFINSDMAQQVEFMTAVRWEYLVGHLYQTVKTMLNHETKHDLVYREDVPSGCRVTLGIQKGLEFIQLFLKKMIDSQHQETTSVACGKVYDETLSKYHSFIKRNTIKFRIYFLTSQKDDLLKKAMDNKEDAQQATEMLLKTLAACAVVHKRIETLYSFYDLQNLSPQQAPKQIY